jgi:hypothetical protein
MNLAIDMFDDDDSQERIWLKDIQQQFKQDIGEKNGGVCPCCLRWGKIHKYKLTQTQAFALKWIEQNAGEDGWVDVQKHAPRWMLRSKTYPLLMHWDLIESERHRSGVWRVNSRGRQFIKGNLLVPSGVFVFDNRVMGYTDAEISFRGCFGVHFDFDEFMSGRFNWSSVKVGKR